MGSIELFLDLYWRSPRSMGCSNRRDRNIYRSFSNALFNSVRCIMLSPCMTARTGPLVEFDQDWYMRSIAEEIEGGPAYALICILNAVPRT